MKVVQERDSQPTRREFLGRSGIVLAASAVPREASAAAILETMAATVQAHVGAAESFDDMTMVVLKRTRSL